MTELLSSLAQVTLSGGMVIAFEAIDPANAAAITGVQVSGVALLVDLLPGGSLASVQFDDQTAQWVPVPLEDQ